jgi:hypothetical protein
MYEIQPAYSPNLVVFIAMLDASPKPPLRNIGKKGINTGIRSRLKLFQAGIMASVLLSNLAGFSRR